MTTRTPRPVSGDSSPEAPSPFCGDQDEEPNHLVAEYEQLCPDGLDEDTIEEDNVVCVEQPAGSSVDTTLEATETTTAEDQGKKKKKKKKL